MTKATEVKVGKVKKVGDESPQCHAVNFAPTEEDMARIIIIANHLKNSGMTATKRSGKINATMVVRHALALAARQVERV